MTRRLHSLVLMLVVSTVALRPVAAQSILDAPKPSAPARESLGRKRSARPPKVRTPRPATGRTGKVSPVGTQNVVAPPVDVELDEDSVCPVLTRLGLITVLEFSEEIDYIWFSDSDRWRLDQDAFQLGISPGKGDDVTVRQTKWSEARETLYVRVSDGFTYKFALTVVAGAPNSFVRVHRKVPPPPPGPTAEELAERARAEDERRAREEAERQKEAARVARKSALAAARAMPLSTKRRKQGDLEARLARPVTISGVTYLAFEVSNRGKRPVSLASAIAPGRIPAATSPSLAPELVLDASTLTAAERRTGVVVIPAPALRPGALILRLQVTGGKPLELPLGE